MGRFAASLLVLCACHAARPAALPEAAAVVQSNLLRADYAGSQACAGCHTRIFKSWQVSPMHRMTRLPQTAELRAPFDGSTFHFKDDQVTFEQHGAERYQRVHSQKFGEHLYRITRVIGGRYREDYVGLEVTSPDGPVVGDPRAELILPASFVFATQSFRLKGYSVMVPERPGLRAGGVWNRTCIFCHNTQPYLDSILGALYGPKAPGYQGEVVDVLLPPERRFAFEVTDEDGLSRALAAEVAHVGGTAPAGDLHEQLGEAIHALRSRFGGDHVIEVGIGCESCHGGSAEHVRDFQIHPTFEPRSPFVRVRTPHTPTRAEWINRTCARCHQVLFSRYPYSWEGGRRHGGPTPGGASINSGEARDYLLGGCAGAMACTTCHDPHTEDSRAKLDAIGDATCQSCHAKAVGVAHSHHQKVGCIDCHMPRKNMGLDYRLSRYHRIGSPTEKARVQGDRPLECALCHADKSVGEIVTTMERWWGKSYDRAALTRLYGSLDADVMAVTLERGLAHEQAVAMAVFGARRDRAALAPIARQLTHPYPLVRYFAKQALESIAGRPCDVDLDQDDSEIAAQAQRWLGLAAR